MKVINPANEAVVRELEEDSAQSVAKKFARAKEGQKAWARRPLSERIAVLKKFRDLVAERKEALSQTMTSETGKPIAHSRNELGAVVGRIVGSFL